MGMPPDLHQLIGVSLDEFRSRPDHDLQPLTRLAIYDAFGPTFAPPEFTARVANLQHGRLSLTAADRARAHQAIITAEHVLPLWVKSLEEAGLSWDQGVLDEVDEDGAAVYRTPLEELPSFLLMLAREALQPELEPARVKALFREECEAHELLGRCCSFPDDEFPQVAWSVGWAAHEALDQALGLGPFNRVPLDAAARDEELEQGGAAGGWALRAYALQGVSGPIEGFDPQRRLEFWEWWLAEAIPAAWASGEAAPSPAKTVPFIQTARPTIRRVGTVHVSETGRTFQAGGRSGRD
jgi:hypothetical protein